MSCWLPPCLYLSLLSCQHLHIYAQDCAQPCKKYTVEKDVYATVKKGKDPKISVKDDHIVIDNGLKTVSPNIKATSVKATKVKGWFDFGSNQKDKKATKATNNGQLPVYFWLLCLIPVGLLYLIYLNEKGRRQRVKERRQARQINK